MKNPHLYVYDFDFIVENFRLEAGTFDKGDNPGEHLVGMTLIITDAADTQGSALPGIVIVNLGDGNLELMTNPTRDGFKDLPLALEGHVFRQAQADPGNTYIHIIILNRGKRFHP
jgi:hypothetical protein